MEQEVDLSPERRRGAVLGTAVTSVSAITTAFLAHSLIHPHLVAADDVVLFTLKVIAALALARLSLICALATRDVLHTSTAASSVHPASFEILSRSRTRSRLAGWLLASAAALGPSTASACPATVLSLSTSSAQASNQDPFLTLETHQLLSPDQPVINQGDENCSSIPEPGWTLPTTTSPLTCRVLGGGAPTTHSRVHVVQRGETVWGIAASYLPRSAGNAQIAASIHAWVKANPLTLAHPDLIQVGDTLTVPTV